MVILANILHWPTMILLFLLCFILNCHGNLIFSQILNLFICDIFEHNNFVVDKEIRYFRFLVINNNCRDQCPIITQSNHWKMEHYWGSADYCEGSLDSEKNCLASGNLRQYTTVPIQCDWFPWTWIWRLLYFYHWYHFEKRPGIV